MIIKKTHTKELKPTLKGMMQVNYEDCLVFEAGMILDEVDLSKAFQAQNGHVCVERSWNRT